LIARCAVHVDTARRQDLAAHDINTYCAARDPAVNDYLNCNAQVCDALAVQPAMSNRSNQNNKLLHNCIQA
jgi:hypothetical protein